MLSAGLITNATLDRAVGNVLRQKFACGLFDGNDTLLCVAVRGRRCRRCRRRRRRRRRRRHRRYVAGLLCPREC